MINREKRARKILAVCLTVLLWLNPAFVRIAIAEEIVEQVTPTPTPESTIITGDANAQAEVETTANTNEDTVAGEITTPPGDCTPPEGETTCPENITIKNDNLAEVTDEATSSATTGDNQITGSAGDATVITGDATASGEIENEVNSNTVILEPSGEPTVSPEAIPEEKTLTVENNNEGTVTNNADVNASTGENLASENLGEATILTGDALAWANILNLLNTNIVGSNFEVFLLDILENGNGEIDLNELWKEILAKNGTDSLQLAGETEFSNLQLLVQNLNQAYLENNVAVNATTGGNQTNENEKATIETGEATAMANVTNIVNTNILGAKFFFGVINILGLFEGNLILPRPEGFEGELGGTSGQSPVIFTNQNEVDIQGQLTAEAETGENEENNNQGDNLITTGDAKAVANSFSLVNLNIWHNNWFFLIINNLGRWTGRIFGWTTPETIEEPQEESQIFQLGFEDSTDGGENLQLPQDGLPLVNFQNQNQATVKNNIQTTASTGQNQANENRGNTQIETGNAFSLANLFNFVNINILSGRWFFGLINVLGSWTGNAIFAYPDVAVSLSNGSGQAQAGETTHYTLNYENEGHDLANDVWLKFELPPGVTYLGDTSGIIPVISGQNCSWYLGNLAVGQGGSFTITVRIDANFPFEEPISFWSKIIPQVKAAENEKEAEITATALIGTTDPESNLNNNSFSIKTLVYQPLPEPAEEDGENETVSQEQPILEISAVNNVGEFVYPGDIVTFEISVKNTGAAVSYNTRLTQELFNEVPGGFGTAEFDLGTIDAGKGGKLTFGLKLADDGLLPVGAYYTVAKATGNAPNGNQVTSNEARTNFDIRWKEISSLFEAKAAGKEEEILGSADLPDCPKNEEVLPYVLLFLLSSLYISSWIKPRLQRLKNEKTD